MSSWDTNPWSNFCDPHWKLKKKKKKKKKKKTKKKKEKKKKKTPKKQRTNDTTTICTPLEIAVGMHFHVQTWH